MPIPSAPKRELRTGVFPAPRLRLMTDWQLRVLSILTRARGHMTRTMIEEECIRLGFRSGAQSGVMLAIGRSDPAKREKYEKASQKTYTLSLLTLEYVEERQYDVDGIREIGVKITPLGRAALVQIEDHRRNKGEPDILPDVTDDDGIDTDATPPPMTAATKQLRA